MTSATFTERDPPEAMHEKVHLLLLDTDGRLQSVNYPLPGGADQALPALIREAYGVLSHPDMPDGVYERMEDRLAVNAGSAGYYLCQTPSGAAFWIAVSFYRTKNGRVVCHFPVTSDKLDLFASFFAHLKREEQEGTDPETSARQLVSLMLSEGVTDYRTLATSIMIEEIGKRDGGRNRMQYRDLSVLGVMLKTLQSIDGCGKKIDAMSERSKLIPYQLKLQAARLEGGRGPFSVIAENHQLLTDSLLQVTADLQAGSSTEINAVTDAIAYVAQSFHAAELLERPFNIAEEDSYDRAFVVDELRAVMDDCNVQVRTVLSDIDRSVFALDGICRRMRRALSGMEMTRMMCKIERANLTRRTEGLEDVESQLQHVESSLSGWMRTIDDKSQAALMLVEQINKNRESAAA